MRSEVNSLAFDFGASSGRAILGRFDGNKIELEEVYRFPNEPVRMGRNFYWDFLRLFYELKNGLRRAASKGIKISSIGIDTWGVDYGLLDDKGNLLSNPVHYRDSRADNSLKDIENTMLFEDIYNITGIQYMPFNTLYQLYAEKKYRPNILGMAKTLLFMPDLFNYYLTGNKYNEYTESSTSQMLDAEKKVWAKDMLEKLGLPANILQDIISPGSIYGTLTHDIQEEVGLPGVPVIAVGSHDTASAVAGAPLEGENMAYLSSGTWALLGVESDRPIINSKSLKYNFTNEGGVEGTIRFLKNINGLWIIQQLKKNWSENVQNITFPDIIDAARKAIDSPFVIDPKHESFVAPINMAESIVNYCRENGQGTPESLGEIAVAAYKGITQESGRVCRNLEEIIGRKLETINMIGGGIQDEFLCQLTADATGKKVIAGPVEASAFGNIIMQLMAIGEIKSLSEGRQLIKSSVTQKIYNPHK